MKYTFTTNAELKGIIDEIKQGTEPTYSIYNKNGRRVLYNFETNTALLTMSDNGIEENNPFYINIVDQSEPEVESPTEKVEDEVTPCEDEEGEQASVSMEESSEPSSQDTTIETSVENNDIESKVEEQTEEVESIGEKEVESLQRDEEIIREIQEIISDVESAPEKVDEETDLSDKSTKVVSCDYEEEKAVLEALKVLIKYIKKI